MTGDLWGHLLLWKWTAVGIGHGAGSITPQEFQSLMTWKQAANLRIKYEDDVEGLRNVIWIWTAK